jgi:hypothetical protein
MIHGVVMPRPQLIRRSLFIFLRNFEPPDLLLDLDRLAFFCLDFDLIPPAICRQHLCQSTVRNPAVFDFHLLSLSSLLTIYMWIPCPFLSSSATSGGNTRTFDP